MVLSAIKEFSLLEGKSVYGGAQGHKIFPACKIKLYDIE